MKTLAPKLSEFFRFELLRVLGTAPFGGCDVAEVIEVAEHIKQDDPESWYRAWAGAAEQAEALAADSRRCGDVHTERWALLRACNYRRSSEFMLHAKPDDARLLSSLEAASSNFREACRLMDSPVRVLEIPYQKTSTLPAYLYLPTTTNDPKNISRNGGVTNEAGAKIPLLVATGGYDSTQEELYFGMAAGARIRGYACLTFEGPGQGVVARRADDRLHLRPDWEVVMGAVLDYAVSLAHEEPSLNIDISRIALVGASMGGYFALRGATDERVSAVVSIDGFYHLGETLDERTPALLRPDSAGDTFFNWMLGWSQHMSFQTRWEFQHAMMATGVDTPADVYRTMSQYRLVEPDGSSILDRVKCPVFLSGARDTLYWTPEQSTLRIFEGLSKLEAGEDGKYLWLPVGWGQGSLQAKVGAWSHFHHKMFQWLDRVLGVRRSVE